MMNLNKFRVIIFSLLMVIAFVSASYGANSRDGSDYLRVDVFEAKMDALISKIDALEKTMNTRFESMERTINTRLEYLEKRINGSQRVTLNGFFCMLVLMLLILGTFLMFTPILTEYIRNRKPALTVDDVKLIIAESQLETK